MSVTVDSEALPKMVKVVPADCGLTKKVDPAFEGRMAHYFNNPSLVCRKQYWPHVGSARGTAKGKSLEQLERAARPVDKNRKSRPVWLPKYNYDWRDWLGDNGAEIVATKVAGGGGAGQRT